MERPIEPKKGTFGGKAIGALVVIATLMGGVAAFFQIREATTKSTIEPGWKELRLGEARLLVPVDWDTIDLAVLDQRSQELGGGPIGRGSTDSSDSWTFGQVDNLPEHGAVPSGELTMYKNEVDLDALMRLESSTDGFLESKKIEHARGKALKITMKRGPADRPFGYFIYYVSSSGKLWRLSLRVQWDHALQTSGTFDRIAKDLYVP